VPTAYRTLETGEMPTIETDAAPPVDRGKNGHRRQPYTEETPVVRLITQRQLANSGLMYPEDGVAESASERQSGG
jgi:hypothetical protein